ncbi:MAG: FAD-binding protein [Eubacteriales bacterium]|nr:FAD-binding protein [Eubacteriales bacterium]
MRESEKLTLSGLQLRVFDYSAVVVGSGAAGLAAAWHLARLKIEPAALITEHMNAGTSRNTGSDKQTYYKLSLAGAEPDSVADMAETLFSGGSMDGDLALVEAALSAACFSRLCDLGVPFPHNQFGEAVGYRTDHDQRLRATSAGPLTSRLMTETLEREVRKSRLTIHDHWQVIRLLPDSAGERIAGLLCLDLSRLDQPDDRYCLIRCPNVIWAVGGPAMLYADSVYPVSQTGAPGLTAELGLAVKNATEWQYGLASVRPRWNVSGSFQQVIPRYLSCDQDGGGPRDFLEHSMPDRDQLLTFIFRKGYEWPFDASRIRASSLIDLLVYQETVIRGRRVYLDFRENPSGNMIDFNALDEAGTYLRQRGAVADRPIERLRRLNQPAIDFYAGHGIDLASEPLEIRLCAQHHNGGLAADLNWQSNLSGFYPIGEVNGSHGIVRPGGSALNSGQVGAVRAAEHIAACLSSARSDHGGPALHLEPAESLIRWLEQSLAGDAHCLEPENLMTEAQQWMSRSAGPFRRKEALLRLQQAVDRWQQQLATPFRIRSARLLPRLCRLRELLLAQHLYTGAMLDYLDKGGGSRGSFLCLDQADLSANFVDDVFNCRPADSKLNHLVQECWLDQREVKTNWRPVRPLPRPDDAFETVWRRWRRQWSPEEQEAADT